MRLNSTGSRLVAASSAVAVGLSVLPLPGFAADVASAPQAGMVVKAQSLDRRWQLTFSDEIQYYSWDSTQGYPHLPLQFPADPRGPGHGSQVYNPVGLQLDGKASDDLQVQFLLRSGYVWSQQTTVPIGGPISAEASTPTDTIIGTTLTYNGFAGVQPFASINVNAPTGKTVLLGNNALARPDPDVSGVPTFGEGWNIGPTVGVNVALTSTLVATFSGGFTSRGAYDREGLIPFLGNQGVASINPGDDWTANTSLSYQASGLTLQLGGSSMWESQTTINGVEIYKTGNRLTVTGGAGYVWNPSWSSQVTAAFTHTNRNIVQNLTPPPLTIVEALNSNSNITQIAASTTYTMGSFAFGPTAGFTFRDHNDYDPTSATFLPAKTSWAAGGMVQYLASQQVTLTSRAEHRWIHEDQNPSLGPLFGFPAISTNVWMVSVAGTVKF